MSEDYPEFGDEQGYAGGRLGDEAFIICIAILVVWGLTAVGFLGGAWLFWAVLLGGGWITFRLCTIWPRGARWWRSVAGGPAALRFRARLAALGKWFQLAFAARKRDGDVAQLMSVTQHLVDTPYNPVRIVFWTGLVVSVAATAWGAFLAFVRLPAVERERDVARADLSTAIEANGKWRDAFDAQKADAAAARAALAQTGVDSARSLAAAGQRSAQNESLRRRSAQRQKEILDAGRTHPDAQPFDGGRWLQRRLEAESDRSAGGDAGPAADAAAPVAAGVLSAGEPAAARDADHPRQ